MRSLTAVFLLATLVLPGLYGCSSGNKSTFYPPSVKVIAGMDMTGSKQGQSVAFADVDGDGAADKLVGAPNYRSESGRTGVVLVYKGMGSTYDSLPAQVLEGDGNFGFAIMNTGDVDGDGKDDFAVAAVHGDGEDVSLSGSVTIFKGGGNGQVIKKLSGEWPLDKFGYSLAVGDLDGDGNRDLIIGAPFSSPTPTLYQQGAVYIYFGSDSFTVPTALSASSTNKGLGWSVAAGDVDGNGIDDLVISASGKVLVYYGNNPFTPVLNSPNVTIVNSASGFGKALAVTGNLDGIDGNEIAIGAPNAVLNLSGMSSRDAGSLYLVTAASGTTTQYARIDGETLFSRFGFSIRMVGSDMAVGAPMADADWNIMSGKVYLFTAASLTAKTPWTDAKVFEGMVKNQAYGTSLAFASTGLLIGAPRSNTDTGGSALIDPSTGMMVPGGSSGGSTGEGGSCH